MKAYDLWFERGDQVAAGRGAADRQIPRPDGPASGWLAGPGPGIDPATWPRGPLTGLPMFHALTLALPEDYQRRGPQYPGIAFFQGEGQFAEPWRPIGSDDPFAADVAAARPHPMLQPLSDIIDGQFALLWLTAAELSGRTPPPPDSRRPGEHEASDGCPNAWDEAEPPSAIWLIERADPNAGLAPVEDDDGPYRPAWSSELRDFEPWAEPLLGMSHLGGTAFPVQAMPEGLTPWYLELEEMSALNFGTGNAQIDLESGVFDWAC